ncbi:MAG TPA: PQQ-binding-like beta-propeller repeat protein, partial [Ktedonosporobacter sp.]|nr:PQQ-binding-like beta-propeller repeat protein [Ktedonosporobacter sp.]
GASTTTPPAVLTPLAISPTAAATPKGNTATTTASTQSTDWTTYHRDLTRTGSIANMPDPQKLTLTWNTQLDGAVYAEPLVVGERVLVATESNTLYALDRHTGQVQWHTTIASPVTRSTLPCGNIDPLGITGTPVYDPATSLLFAVAEVGGPAHILVGLDINTGQVKVRRSVDPPGMDPLPHQQRAALTLFHGMVYIAFGGLYGDCGDYHGWVVASQTNGQGSLLSYQVPTTREGGIWAVAGPAIDSAGKLYVSVGNGEATGGNWDHSDSVLRLSPTLQLEDGFAPTQWGQDNAGDSDLGSMAPVLLPDGTIFIVGKSGQAYTLHANVLGGVGGQIQQQYICGSYGGAASEGSSVYVPCANGIRLVQVGPDGGITSVWRAPANVTSSPVVGGNTVYSLDPTGGTLYALNAQTGAVRTSLSIGEASRFTSPTLSGTDIFVGTLSGVAAVRGS